MPRPPDILWILSTQWRGQALGCMGDGNARTPHLDALAAEGVLYRQAITPHPFGPFARAALLTGVTSPENGVADYFDPLPRGSRTIAHRLSAFGYDTAFFGKWHLSRRDASAPLVGEAHARQLVEPEDRGGFDFWEGFESGFLLNGPWLHGTRLAEPRQFPGYQSDVLCDRALEMIRAKHRLRDRSPFFCVLSLEAPHPPYDAPTGGLTPADPASLTLPANVPLGGEAESRARRELAGYYAHIEATDRALGKLLSDPALDETCIAITSVHGDMHGAHGLFRKGWPYDESLRVPLLLRLPRSGGASSRRPGAEEMGVVSLMDLHSWTLGWAESRLSVSDYPAAKGSVLCSMPNVVRLPHQCDRSWRAIRTTTRKLVLNEDRSPWLYFDLSADPLELNNLADSPAHQAEIAEMARHIRA